MICLLIIYFIRGFIIGIQFPHTVRHLAERLPEVIKDIELVAFLYSNYPVNLAILPFKRWGKYQPTGQSIALPYLAFTGKIAAPATCDRISLS